MATAIPMTEGDILERIISSKEGTLPSGVARSLLEFQFPDRDTAQIRKLLRKNNAGTISDAERAALEKYLRIGQFLDLLHAKAKSSLAKHAGTRQIMASRRQLIFRTPSSLESEPATGYNSHRCVHTVP